jgi:hypothetical protein
LYGLELWLLKRFCDKHGIDYAEIDTSLEYWECKEELQKRFMAYDPEERMKAWESELVEYLDEHFLSDYIMAALSGETVSHKSGAPIKAVKSGFSLAEYIKCSHLFWGE